MTNYTEEELAQMLKDNPDLKVVKPAKRQDSISGQQPSTLKMAPVAGTSKYRAQRTEYNGRNYPSKRHAEVAYDLDLMRNGRAYDSDTIVRGRAYDGIIEEIPRPTPAGLSFTG